ncbi:class I SAM-dependent methyltransferase [Patescibacteria group bacterium]|nr:class I SAM-dependent methyltransferase [Patescibacteria group bacterium]
MNEEETTQKTYNQIAEKWAAEHNDVDYFRKEFGKFSQLLSKGKILDVGCGWGRDCSLFKSTDYEYTGVDYSKGLLEIARANFPQVKFVEGNILDLPFKENEFDGFWAAASLLHIPKAKIQEALKELKRITKSGGVGFIALKKGQGEEMSKDERFFAYWQYDEFESVLLKAGFEVLDFIEHPESDKTIWIAFFVKI